MTAAWTQPSADWDRRLWSPAPRHRLELLQGALLAVLGVRLALRRWWVMAERPAALFEPVAVLAWLPAPPGVLAIVVTWMAGLAAVAGGIAALRSGRSAQGALAVAWLSLLLLAGLWGSAGKVLHNDLLLLTVCVPLLFAPSVRRDDSTRPQSGWPARAVLVLLAVVYFLTGYQKLRHSGLSWVFSSNMSWVIRRGQPVVPEDLARSLADELWLTQALAGGALLLELAAPALLAVRRTRLWFAAAATVMHTSIWALLGLDYYGWVLTVWAVVLPFSTAADRLVRWFDVPGGEQ